MGTRVVHRRRSAVAAVLSSAATLLLLAVCIAAGPAATSHPAFVHPGLLHNRAELDFIKARVKAGVEPWKSAWDGLRSHSLSQLDRTPQPIRDVIRGAFSNPDIGAGNMERDAAAASRGALRAGNSDVRPAPEAPPRPGKVAAKPLFRDPVYDGAADPVVCWNRQERKWFLFYTNRRANVPNTPGVSWVHGTPIGIAESSDGGATWKYRGTADIAYGQGDYSYWAPEILHHDGVYHMFLSFVPGMHTDWSGTRDILHLTSADLLKWTYVSTLQLSSHRVIDACVIRLADGTWRLWYNNEADRKSIYYADSRDLYTWKDRGKAIGDQPGEGPNVFRWKDRYWMVVDVWDGLGVYRSDDALKWTRQSKNLLQGPGQGPDDRVKGGHADVVVSGDRAFMFYFTHPGRRNTSSKGSKDDSYERRRSSIQVVELECQNGELTCDRDKPTHILLEPADSAK